MLKDTQSSCSGYGNQSDAKISLDLLSDKLRFGFHSLFLIPPMGREAATISVNREQLIGTEVAL